MEKLYVAIIEISSYGIIEKVCEEFESSCTCKYDGFEFKKLSIDKEFA